VRAIFGDLLGYTSRDRRDIQAIATLDSDFDVYRRYRKKHERARVFAIARRICGASPTEAAFCQTSVGEFKCRVCCRAAQHTMNNSRCDLAMA
jgi:hypothetical protein